MGAVVINPSRPNVDGRRENYISHKPLLRCFKKKKKKRTAASCEGFSGALWRPRGGRGRLFPPPRPSGSAERPEAGGKRKRGTGSGESKMPHIDNDIKLDFKDVLLRPKRSTLKSRSEVDLLRSFSFRNSKQTYRGIPIIAANMDTVGTFEMAKVLSKFSLFTAIHKHCTVEEWQEFAAQHPDCLQNVAASTGTSDLEHLERVLEAVPQIRYICLDVANGYSEHFVQFLRDLRKRYPDHTIMAGNVVTGEMVEELILSGADIIKVGIGPGSVCTTRKKTGVGYPQLSAVMECADAAHGLGGHIISDGGCHCPGDVAKAFGAGADFVMVGGMLAGHTESGGDLIEKEGKKYKLFYGMSSEVSMKKYTGGVADYRASEGKVVEVPFKGDVEHTLRDILGGIRSTCTYVGAAKLKELSRRTTFIRVTQQVNPIFGGEDQP